MAELCRVDSKQVECDSDVRLHAYGVCCLTVLPVCLSIIAMTILSGFYIGRW